MGPSLLLVRSILLVIYYHITHYYYYYYYCKVKSHKIVHRRTNICAECSVTKVAYSKLRCFTFDLYEWIFSHIFC